MSERTTKVFPSQKKINTSPKVKPWPKHLTKLDLHTHPRASKSGINVRDPILRSKCPDNIFGEKGPINIINNEPYSVYMLYYDQLLSILKDLVNFSSKFGRKLVRLCGFS